MKSVKALIVILSLAAVSVYANDAKETEVKTPETTVTTQETTVNPTSEAPATAAQSHE